VLFELEILPFDEPAGGTDTAIADVGLGDLRRRASAAVHSPAFQALVGRWTGRRQIGAHGAIGHGGGVGNCCKVASGGQIRPAPAAGRKVRGAAVCISNISAVAATTSKRAQHK